MKRNVALKMLPHHFSQDESAIRRFEREVEVAAKLNHRNIVAALDAREQEGNHYLIMEFVEGRAPSTVVHDDGVLPVPTAIDYTAQAAIGLAPRTCVRCDSPGHQAIEFDGRRRRHRQDS